MKRALHVAGHVGVGAALTGAIVTFAAAPAFAGTGSLSVSPGGTQTANTVLNAVGSDDNSTGPSSDSLKLSVSKPDGSTQVVTGTVQPLSKGSVKAAVDTGAVNVNGDYVFTLSINGTAAKSATVTLRVPPAAVSGFAGSPSGTVAHFTWSPNSEPDLAGYDIVDVTDAQQPRDLTPSGLSPSVCNSGGCAVDIDFGSSAQGTSRTFVAYALRYTSPAHSSTLASASPSSAATVAFPAPAPPPSTAPAGDGSGGTTPGSGGGSATTGGTTSPGQTSGSVSSGGGTAGRGGSHSTGKPISTTHASKALKAYLPTISAGAAPNLPAVVTEVQPLPQGTYKPTLAYPDQVVGQAVHKRTTTPVASVRDELVRVLDVSALWKALGAAAVVLLVAGHLRAWLESVDLNE